MPNFKGALSDSQYRKAKVGNLEAGLFSETSNIVRIDRIQNRLSNFD